MMFHGGEHEGGGHGELHERLAADSLNAAVGALTLGALRARFRECTKTIWVCF